MGDRTNIEWADATWNVVTGCTRISRGCDVCYIERQPPFRMNGRQFDGPDLGATTGVQLHPDRLSLPLRWRRSRRIFVNSLSDAFHKDVPDGFIAQVWDVMARSPQHSFLILTKRHGPMRSWVRRWADIAADENVPMENGLPPMPRGPEATRAVYTSGRGQLFAAMLDQMGTPPPGAAYPTYDWMEGPRWWPDVLSNVWLGVSAEDQEHAARRILALLETPAAVRWVSAEPLLGPIDLRSLPGRSGVLIDCLGGDVKTSTGETYSNTPSVLDWVVAGGESGPGARPMHPDWVRALRDACQQARVPFLFKQWGAWAPAADQPRVRDMWVSPDGETRPWRHGDGHVRWGLGEYRAGEAVLMRRSRKAVAGRQLDGTLWDEYPGGQSA